MARMCLPIQKAVQAVTGGEAMGSAGTAHHFGISFTFGIKMI